MQPKAQAQSPPPTSHPTPSGHGNATTSEIRPDIGENTDLSTLSDAEIFALTQNIKDEESTRRPLIAPILPLATLRAEYENGEPSFVQKIDWLSRDGWNGIRKTRGDGDCFYRSLAFAYVERILNAPDQSLAVATSLSTLESTLPLLENVGFQAIVYEDFYDALRAVITNISSPDDRGHRLNASTLLKVFQDPEMSNSIVVYLRLLTSAHIRLNYAEYLPFLFHPDTFEPMTTREFCESQVEAVGKEADHPQMQALSQALKIDVKVAYLDRNLDPKSSGGKVDFVNFDAEGDASGANSIVLLYRPGHYDILERRGEEPTE